jgi:hypothetical protein
MASLESTPPFKHRKQASKMLRKMCSQVWTYFASRLNWATARWHHANAVKTMREYPEVRWSDYVEREINHLIVYGDRHGGKRQ